MNRVRTLILSAAMAAAASGSLQASEAPYPLAPVPNQELITAQQKAFEAQQKIYLQAAEAQQKAIAEYRQKMYEQQQAFMKAQREAIAQQQNAIPPQLVTPYGMQSNWAEAQHKAMEVQREEIEKQMRSAMEQQQAFMDAQRNARLATQEFTYAYAPTPALVPPYFAERFSVQREAFDKERKTYLDAVRAQRKEIAKQMQKRYEERQTAFEAQRKAFEEFHRSLGGPLASSDTAKQN